jgi:hypothetical protein
LEVENIEGFFESRAQQTSKKLQEYGVDSFEAECIRKAQSGHW